MPRLRLRNVNIERPVTWEMRLAHVNYLLWDAAASELPLFGELNELIERESELISGIQEEVEWMERELRLMESVLESVRGRGDKEDLSVMEWAKETEEVVRKAEDLIAKYMKGSQKQGTVNSLKQVFNLAKRRKLAIKLEVLMTKIYRLSKEGKKIIIGNGNETSASERAGFRSNMTASSAMEQLDTVWSEKWSLHVRDLEAAKSMREELTPLQDLLDELEGSENLQLSEKQKVWVQEIKGIFQLVDQTFEFLEELSSLSNLLHLDKKILKIRKQISEICRRYHTYEIGEFRGRENWRVVVPKLISRGIDHTSVFSVLSSTKDMAEWLRVEMELMKSLSKDDAKHKQIREYPDERTKAWFLLMDTICHDLDDMAKRFKDEKGCLFVRHSKFVNNVKVLMEIEKQIYFITDMIMTYDISSGAMQQQSSNAVIPGDGQEPIFLTK